MSNCTSCSAPLPSASNLCTYCGTRNDTDFHGVHKYTLVKPESERVCPRCNEALQTVDLKLDGKFYIERCNKCMGVFFDPGELEVLLEKSVTNVFKVDHKRLNALTKELYQKKSPVTYIKCPVCDQFMKRSNYASRSGVIVDRCREHGVWLDGGELKHLMEWKKVGGQLLDKQRKVEKEEEISKKAKRATSNNSNDLSDIMMSNYRDGNSFSSYTNDSDVFNTVANIVGKLFK